MNTEIFFQTIMDFDNGYDDFNLGQNWCFLFNQKWYPTRSFMVKYMINANMSEPQKMNLYTAVYELSKIIPIYTKQINFLDHQPVDL
jgi:hypothetical protein